MNILLIDYSHVLYKNIFTHPTLSFNGQFTGGSYGFLMSMTKLLKTYPEYRVVLCRDCPPYFREIDVPQYKGDRPRHDSDSSKMINDSVRQIDSIINTIGVPTLRYQGLEADDVIGLVVKQYACPDNRIVIASNDSDLYQLLQYQNVVISKKSEDEYDYATFQSEFPTLQPKHWPIVVALSGSHNGVAGIKGIGLKTAYKLLLKGNAEIKTYIGVDQVAVLERNIGLATVPYPRAERHVDLPQAGKYDERGLIRALAMLGIQLTFGMASAFLKYSEVQNLSSFPR